jgi:valyl-tRNA synthetase
MSSGQDVRFSEDKVAQGQQLTNKLWNASRLILLRVDPSVRADVRPTTVEDRWILSRLARARQEVSGRIERYDFSRAALELYDFVYGELCDWYLELVNPRLYEGDSDTAATLLHVLTETLAMAHPLIPFVTEEIYGYIPGSSGLLAGGRARIAADAGSPDVGAEAEVERAIQAIQAIRAWRDAADVKPSAILPAQLRAEGYGDTLDHLARLGRLELGANGAAPGAEGAAAIAIPGGVVEILPSADVDLGAAARKREAKRAELQSEIVRAEKKLGNAGFVAKAPPEVVEAERAKLEDLRAELGAL